MRKHFFDFKDGDLVHPISDKFAMDSDGDLMMRLNENMSMDLDSGDIHFTSSWSNNKKDEDD